MVGVNLKATFKIADLAGFLEEDGYETAFLEAMLRQMTVGGQLEGDVTIDPAKCVRWLGQVVLLNAGPEGLPEHEFVSRWSGSLPDPWKDEAQILSGLDAVSEAYLNKARADEGVERLCQSGG